MKTFLSNHIQLIALAGLLLLPVGWVEAGITTRVSVDSAGGQANSPSFSPSISADGRFVAFESWADNLVAGDTNSAGGGGDIFVRDRQTGATTRVSVDSAGRQANYSSKNPSISADGRFVAFDSYATNLVADDTNSTWDIFVHDRQTGATTRVNVDSAGGQANGPISISADGFPSISADGRFVAFSSRATNLVAGDTNQTLDVFVHDRQTGATTRVSGDSTGNEVNGVSWSPSISADGRFVAFYSSATNLVADDTNSTWDIFVHDRQTGATTRVNVDSAGGQANGPISIRSADGFPSISADGRFVAFSSRATNLVAGDTNQTWDVFVHDRQTGTTTRVSVNSAGVQGNNDSAHASISADGRFVAFSSRATNLVAGGTKGSADVFRHDRQTGVTTHVNVDSAGGHTNYYGFSSRPAINTDGRFVAFSSIASNLVAGDTNNGLDVFIHQVTCDLDADCDGTPDTQDNCLYVANGPTAPDAGGQSQRDTNGDGFGNVCDADLNNDGLVTTTDFMILRRRLNTADPDADLNGDGVVTVMDYQMLRRQLNQTPGPSGLVAVIP